MLKKIEQVTELLDAYKEALELFSIKTLMGQTPDNPGKTLTSMVKAHVLDPSLDLLKWTGSKDAQALYDAVCDVQIFGTTPEQAAEESGVCVSELAWVLSRCEGKFAASSRLKKRRNIRR